MNLTLTRKYGDMATTGTLTDMAGSFTFYTVELPWADNHADQSCVPEGLYELVPYESPKHGPTWCLHNPSLGIYSGTPQGVVNFRAYCEIHAANWAEQLLGCIALGLEGQPTFDPITGRVEPAVEESRDAVARFLEILGPMSTGHMLSITHAEEA